jgi:putative SOS response-associated peptidase YedK
MTIGDDENVKKLSEKLRELAMRKTANERKNLKPTSRIPTIAEMIAEGEKLLREDAKVKAVTGLVAPTKKKTDLPPTNQNPYVQARHQILSKYPEWRRKEVAEMEKTGNLNNQFYDAFIKEVSVLGDKLSNNS